MDNWFEDWFDSPLYEKLYANRDEREASKLVDFLVDTIELPDGSRILDLGCGRGRHSITLTSKGYHVTGIDLSEEAINTAKAKAAKMDLENIRFEKRDMRKPLPETFDAIVNLFTTFGYFKTDKENAGVFDSVVKMLEPGGIFVLDYLNAEKVRNSYRPKDSGQFQDIEYHIQRYIHNDAIIKEINFEGERINGRTNYSERVKLYDLSWFRQELGKRGLVIDHTYGDYDGNEFDPETSTRLLLISHLEGK